MKIFGNTQITTIEGYDFIRVIIAREHGWAEIVIQIVILGVFACLALTSRSGIFILFFLVALVWFLWLWFGPSDTALVVTEHGVVVKGNLDSTFATSNIIPASEIRSLAYSIGSEDDSPGLYADRDGIQTCLLPDLDKDKADEIAAIIRQKFPDLEQGDTNPNSMLFGAKDDPISLGLSSLR